MLSLQSVLSATALLFALSATAAPALPPSRISGDLFFNFSPPARLQPTDFGTLSLSDSRFGSLSVSSTASPFPSVTANATIGIVPLASIFGRSVDVLIYSVEIVGPTGAVPVLIDVAGAASATATRGASFAVESSWTLFDAAHQSLASDDIRSGQLTGSFDESFNHTVSLSLNANQIYSVQLFADAASAATDLGSRASASAFVDPIFSFGRGVDLSSYAFNFSAGIGNARSTAAVAEPSSLVLLSTGGLALGLIRRRRRAGQRARHSELRIAFRPRPA